ncbi:MAG: OmpH family outer membrane protein [bacterium]|nr:OmpH family outer membrane protein [bacterium]MDD5354101.1 OmpH family outer membrane protein [bacterium]MDD5756367.1 OmpH family outer membrane protein [bacterium]
MKRLIAVIIVGTILISAGIVLAAGLKIGYVDVASVFDKYSGTAAAKLVLEKEIKAKQDTIQQMSEAVKKLRESLDQTGGTLSLEDKKIKALEIDRQALELQKFTEESENELSRKEANYTQDILAKIHAAVQKVGKEKGFSLVLDKNSVIFGIDSWNITENVLKTLEGGVLPLSSPTTGYLPNPDQEPLPSKGADSSPYNLNIKED